MRSVGLGRSCPNRNGESLIAVPGGGAVAAAGLKPEGSKAEVLARLRTHITALERGSPNLPSVPEPQAGAAAWTLGEPELDQRLGMGLEAACLHEVKAAAQASGVAAGDWAAALGFALRLTVRRLQSFRASSAGPARVLWCWPSMFARELGGAYGPGLAALGVEPSSWLFVETGRAADALWAMEEGLRSQSLALVVGVLSEVELTPARRLSLVAAEHATPCLFVTDPRLSPAGSTATRWRVGACASGMHPFNALAPGAPRYAVALERCRHRPLTHESSPVLLEWLDETHRFRMAAAVADRTHGPCAASAYSG